MQRVRENTAGSWLASVGIRLSNWFERWFPDAFAIALAPVVIVFTACVLVNCAVGSVIVQYPLHAGIVRMMTESGLADRLAEFFVAVSTFHTFPLKSACGAGVLRVSGVR